jgi:hypothetical protein
VRASAAWLRPRRGLASRRDRHGAVVKRRWRDIDLWARQRGVGRWLWLGLGLGLFACEHGDGTQERILDGDRARIALPRAEIAPCNLSTQRTNHDSRSRVLAWIVTCSSMSKGPQLRFFTPRSFVAQAMLLTLTVSVVLPLIRIPVVTSTSADVACPALRR